MTNISEKNKLKNYPATRRAYAKGERRCRSYSFLTSVLDGLSGHRHAPAALHPRKRTPGTHWAGGSATLSVTNPTWIDLSANPCLRCERLATNRLSHSRPISELLLKIN
jgi:hypothetical protein